VRPSRARGQGSGTPTGVREYVVSVHRFSGQAGDRISIGGVLMDCEEFLVRYSDFLDGRLEEHPFSEYVCHIEECPKCAEYHCVMRRGLRLVRELEGPETTPDFMPRLQQGLFEGPRSGGRGEYTRAAAMVGFTAVGLLFLASLPVVGRGSRALELPPVVVERPSYGQELHALWGPPPTFATRVSFQQVPSLSSTPLRAPPREGFSLFRTTRHDSVHVAGSEELAPE
jgi:hypothetical protein